MNGRTSKATMTSIIMTSNGKGLKQRRPKSLAEDRFLWREAQIQRKLTPFTHVIQMTGHEKDESDGQHVFAMQR